MNSIELDQGGAARSRRRLTTAIKESLRQMTTQLSLLNHQISTRVDLKDVDLNCLDLIARHGPLSPTALARRAGLHPATVTGILDRLERGAGSFVTAIPMARTAARSRSACCASAPGNCCGSTPE